RVMLVFLRTERQSCAGVSKSTLKRTPPMDRFLFEWSRSRKWFSTFIENGANKAADDADHADGLPPSVLSASSAAFGSRLSPLRFYPVFCEDSGVFVRGRSAAMRSFAIFKDLLRLEASRGGDTLALHIKNVQFAC